MKMDSKKIVFLVGVGICAWIIISSLIPSTSTDADKSVKKDAYAKFDWNSWPISKDVPENFHLYILKDLNPRIIYPIDLLDETQKFKADEIRKQFFSGYSKETGQPISLSGEFVVQAIYKLTVKPFKTGIIVEMVPQQGQNLKNPFSGIVWWYIPAEENLSAKIRNEYAMDRDKSTFNFPESRPLVVLDYTPPGRKIPAIIHVYAPSGNSIGFGNLSLEQKFEKKPVVVEKKETEVKTSSNVAQQNTGTPSVLASAQNSESESVAKNPTIPNELPVKKPAEVKESAQTPATAIQSNAPSNIQQSPDLKPVPPKPGTPVFQPGVSKLYTPKDFQKLINADVKNAWVSGKFTIKSGGPSVPAQLACFEAGTQTKLVWDSILKKPSSSSTTPFYIFGWYFNEKNHSGFMKFKDGTVFTISESAPAKIEKVYYFEGHPTLLAMLVNPPAEEE